MNKYEQLIEHIINEDEQAAKELFHQLVVEKSRDIYESLMDEEIGGDASANMMGSVQGEVQGDELGEDDDEMDLDGEDEFGTDDDMADMDGEEETFGDDGEMGGEEAEHGEIESKIDDLSAQLEELKGMLAGEEHSMDDMGDMGGEEGESDFDMDGEEGGEEFGAEGGEEFGESANPFAKSGSGKSGSASGSGKSGSGVKEAKKMSGSGMSGSGMSGSGKSGSGIKEAAKASGSGVSGSGKSGSGKSGSGKMESYKKTDVEIMKEYVDKIGEIYSQEPAKGEGKTVGTGGDEPTVNKKSTSLDKGPDFGGTNENILSGQGNEQAADGKQFKAPNNEYTKKRGDLPGAGQFKNVPGNKKVWDQKGPADGHGAEKKGTETGKTVGAGGDKPSLNTKGIEGGAGQPTGKKK